MKKIEYCEPQYGLPDMCEECGIEFSTGDDVYYHSPKTYTCSEECARKYEDK